MKKPKIHIDELSELKARMSECYILLSEDTAETLLENLAGEINNGERSKVLGNYSLVALCSIAELHCKSLARYALDDYQFLIREDARILKQSVDLDNLLHLRRQKLTVGDLVASSISVNKIEDYIGICNDLLAANEDAADKNFDAELMVELERVGRDPAADKRALSQAFKFRHIIVHEVPFGLAAYSNQSLVPADFHLHAISAARAVIRATNEVFSEFFKPRIGLVPEVEASYEQAGQAYAQMQEIFQSGKRLVPSSEIEQYELAQSSFQEFVEAEADLKSIGCLGMGLHTTPNSFRFEEYSRRIEHLEDLVERLKNMNRSQGRGA